MRSLPIRTVTLLCPAMVTGGPQALHQLAFALNRRALPTQLAYYANGGQLVREGDAVRCVAPPQNPCLVAYDKYCPVPAERFALTSDHLVVLPEVLAHLHRAYAPAQAAVWWLSVDNAFHERAALLNEKVRLELFADRGLRHWAPTFYAREFLRRQGVPEIAMLSDHVDDQFTTWQPEGPGPDAVVAYNPRKGGELAAAFFARHPDLTPRPITGLDRRGVWAAFRRARVYVDFSHFPGREFMPREAAASGAVIFVRNRGAAQFYDDYPLPDAYRFTDAALEDGSLYARVSAALAEPESHWLVQESLRQNVRWEAETFERQADRLVEQLSAVPARRSTVPALGLPTAP
ncbi:hypothetical protein GCM10007886_01960 [Methylobacterium gregans]|nr:hypothetical protein GCM10007886_01960 [Methylobacterium gregans]